MSDNTRMLAKQTKKLFPALSNKCSQQPESCLASTSLLLAMISEQKLDFRRSLTLCALAGNRAPKEGSISGLPPPMFRRGS